MGIMDIIKSPSFIKGAVKEGISIYDKAEEVGQEGLENLKIARKEVANRSRRSREFKNCKKRSC